MPQTDRFASNALSLTGPVEDGFDVTPDDSTDLEELTRGFTVTTAGDVEVMFASGRTLVLPARQPGIDYACRVRRVLATGTTAGGIKALV